MTFTKGKDTSIHCETLSTKPIIFPKAAYNPEDIYHYTSIGGLFSVLKNTTLWFTNIGYLNDMDEVSSGIQTLAERITGSKQDKLIEGVSVDDLRKNMFVCCFSIGDDLLPMWNYYTKEPGSQGFNIRFKKEDLLRSILQDNECLDGCNITFGPIDYCRGSVSKYIAKYWDGVTLLAKQALHSIGEQIINDKQILEAESQSIEIQKKRYKNSFPKLFRFNGISCKFEHSLEEVFGFIKRDYFAHEKEFRIIINVPDDRKKQLIDNGVYKYRPANGLIIPYLELKFDKMAVKGITISPTVHSDLAQRSMQDFLGDHGYSIAEIPDFIKRSEIPVRF